MEKIAIIFIGLQGSGKTYFYNEYLAKDFAHINLDELHTRNNEVLKIDECIKAQLSIVIDNTNPQKSDRNRYIPMLKEEGYIVKGYYFESKLADCIRRNNTREGKAKIPEKAIAATSNSLSYQ